MPHWVEIGRTLATALPVSCSLGVLAASGFAAAPARVVTLLRSVALALLIPAAALTIWPSLLLLPKPVLIPDPVPARLVAGTLPALLLPILARCARLPPGQARAAAGLGAGPLAMIRLVWLPQLAPPVATGLLLVTMLDLAATLQHG